MKTSRTLSVHASHSPFPIAAPAAGKQGRRGVQRLTAFLLLFAALVGALPASAAETGHPGVVNVNTADADQLKQLPRVGPALADRILAHREANGEFESVEDLILVQGIGEKTFEMLRTFVTTKGETTLSRKLKTSDVPASAGSGGAPG